jgi:hypothetical protein
MFHAWAMEGAYVSEDEATLIVESPQTGNTLCLLQWTLKWTMKLPCSVPQEYIFRDPPEE